MTGHVAQNRIPLGPGEVFGRWTVLARAANNPKNKSYYLCRCECGTEKPVDGYNLRKGLSPSCGCVTRSRRGRDSPTYKHGRSFTGTYNSWSMMKRRCQDPTNNRYAIYGGRGITVCDRWLDFANFLADMGDRPEGTTLDRIDTDGNYELGNCRWATPSEQAFNRRPRRADAASTLPPSSVDGVTDPAA